jgi:hypothetical protein
VNVHSQDYIPSEKGSYSLNLVDSLFLYDVLEHTTDQIGTFALNDKFIFHATQSPVSLFAYDLKTGEQILKFGNMGRGPYEYQNPWHLRLSENKLHLLDYVNGLMSFDFNGHGVDNQLILRGAYSDFVLSDSLLILRRDQSPNHLLIEIRNTESNAVIHETGLGSPDDAWLKSIPKPGGLMAEADTIWYIHPSRLELIRYNITDRISKSITYQNNRFRNPVFQRTMDQVQQNPQLLFDYLLNRSVVTGFYRMSTDLHIIEIVHFDRENGDRLELMLLDASYKWHDSFFFSTDFNKKNGERIRAIAGNRLLFYSELSNADNISLIKQIRFYKLNRMPDGTKH